MAALSNAPRPPAPWAPASPRKRGEGVQCPSSPSPRSRGEGRGEGQAQRLCVGIVTGPHGVHGAVRIKSFMEVPQDIARYGPVEDEAGRRRFDVTLCGAAKGVLLARLSGVEDRDQAEALRGLRLYLSRVALPQTEAEEYYHADLIGLEAVLGDGTPVGRVRAIYDFGAGDTLELARLGAPPVLVPFTRAIVPVVEPAQGRLVLEPPPGLLDGGES
jgi:16S rRNA processing protein RimM